MNNQFTYYLKITSLHQLMATIRLLQRQTKITNLSTGYLITIRDLEKDGPELLDWYDMIDIKIVFKTQKQLDNFTSGINQIPHEVINNHQQSIKPRDEAWLEALKELE